MYQKPTLKKFGTFRELTLIGDTGGSDLQTVNGITGCINPDGDAFNCPTTS